jgi:anti-sigma factor RsiW
MDGHDLRNDRADARLNCPDCRHELQDYLDGTLDKKRSLGVFLHLRECAACRLEHDAMHAVFTRLDLMPELAPPADFDAAVLASVPYAAYRAMEPLRRERVPVFLEDHFLPAWLRARATRAGGLVAAAGATGAWLAGPGQAWLLAVAAVGLVPEILLRLQMVGRRLVGVRQAEG